MLLRIADQAVAMTDGDAGTGSATRLSGVRAMVLLAGSVRANALRRLTRRPALEMPVSLGRSVLDCWREQALALAEASGIGRLPVRVVLDQDATLEPCRLDVGPVSLSIEQDPADFRGTGGLLRDIAEDYDDDDRILVTHAAQLLFEPLSSLAGLLAGPGCDVAMLSQADGLPGGMMLVRCGCLREIKDVGFVDLNEQALPEIAARGDVRVVRRPKLGVRSLRTLSGYVSALREYHDRALHRGREVSPWTEQWRPSFQIVEAGARVDDGVVLHDSVVLGGARVKAGAVVVRSVVCPGVTVSAGREVVDQVLGPSYAQAAVATPA